MDMHQLIASQVTSYKLQVTSYKLQVTSYKLQVTSYKLQVTSYKKGDHRSPRRMRPCGPYPTYRKPLKPERMVACLLYLVSCLFFTSPCRIPALPTFILYPLSAFIMTAITHRGFSRCLAATKKHFTTFFCLIF